MGINNQQVELTQWQRLLDQNSRTDADQFEDWFDQAAPGERYVYFVGELARFRELGGYMKVKAKRERSLIYETITQEMLKVNQLGAMAHRLAREGKVYLVQRRVEPFKFRYVAIRA